MTPELIRPAIFDALPDVFATFTTRHFARTSRADAKAAASRLAEQEGFFGTSFTEQVHEDRVAAVDAPGTLPGHDGLVTRKRGLLLGTVAADCALILLADPEAGVVGTCHAGWRGAVRGIIPRTVEMMQELGARPGRTLAYVGPCISAEAFEVGEEVAARFDPAFVYRRPEWERPRVDLRAAVATQLRASGIPSTQLEVSDACTVTTPQMFYSYRGEDGTGGRMLGLIGIRPAS